MSQNEIIQSATEKVSLKDNFHWAFLGSAAWKCALILPGALFLILMSILLLSGQETTFEIIFIETVFPSLVALILMVIWSLFFVIMGYRKLSESQLINTWRFSEENIAVKDKAGNEVVRPWSQVSYVRYSDKGVRVVCKPMGSLWIPKRFLIPDDLVKLKKLTKKLNLV